MIVLKSPREIEALGRVNRIVAEILEIVRGEVKPGVSTAELEEVVDREILRRGVQAAFRGVKNPQGVPFPSSICVSINDEIVHGIPSSKRILKEGDLLSVDFGVFHEGFYGDSAFSVGVGVVKERVRRLIQVAETSLAAGIGQAVVGGRLGDISAAVQEVVEGAGYHVVREFVGHGIGRSLHEDPQVPNFGKRNSGVLLKEGMVIAIEPMINDGQGGIKVDADGWTARTKDGSLAAHAEHSIAITADGPLVLSRIA